jgi:hypothetical protein
MLAVGHGDPGLKRPHKVRNHLDARSPPERYHTARPGGVSDRAVAVKHLHRFLLRCRILILGEECLGAHK